MKEITACFTGHRSLPDNKLNQLSETLKTTICEAYDKGYRCFCSGGAVGFDLLAAEAVLSLKGKYNDMKLILVIPCPEQTKYWPDKEIKRYEQLKKDLSSKYANERKLYTAGKNEYISSILEKAYKLYK